MISCNHDRVFQHFEIIKIEYLVLNNQKNKKYLILLSIDMKSTLQFYLNMIANASLRFGFHITIFVGVKRWKRLS